MTEFNGRLVGVSSAKSPNQCEVVVDLDPVTRNTLVFCQRCDNGSVVSMETVTEHGFGVVSERLGEIQRGGAGCPFRVERFADATRQIARGA